MTFLGILEVREEKTRIWIRNPVVQIRGFVSISKRGLNTDSKIAYTQINKKIKIKFWHPKWQKRQDKEPDQNQYKNFMDPEQFCKWCTHNSVSSVPDPWHFGVDPDPGPMPLTNGSRYGSGYCYFHHWTSRQQKTSLKRKFCYLLFFKGTFT